MQTPKEIAELAYNLSKIKDVFPIDDYRSDLNEAIENDASIMACKKGISSNIVEFISHVLRQRQTSETGMESYDQGYLIKKKGTHNNAPWVVGFGPVALLTMVHNCTATSNGPRTVQDLCDHISKYGYEMNAQDIPDSEVGASLRNLGLVIDSPDAEGGMVLDSPFSVQENTEVA